MADNRCVCCGEIIPEGMIACPNCLVVSKKEKKMTVKQAFDSIVEDGLALGAGDFVDTEALEVAAVILAKLLRGHLVEVVHGRWEDVSLRFTQVKEKCSVCGGIVYAHGFNYCPNCGAKMDGDGNG